MMHARHGGDAQEGWWEGHGPVRRPLRCRRQQGTVASVLRTAHTVAPASWRHPGSCWSHSSVFDRCKVQTGNAWIWGMDVQVAVPGSELFEGRGAWWGPAQQCKVTTQQQRAADSQPCVNGKHSMGGALACAFPRRPATAPAVPALWTRREGGFPLCTLLSWDAQSCDWLSLGCRPGGAPGLPIGAGRPTPSDARVRKGHQQRYTSPHAEGGGDEKRKREASMGRGSVSQTSASASADFQVVSAGLRREGVS